MFSKNKIIIFIGSDGLLLNFISNNVIKDSIFIKNRDNNQNRKYKAFLSKYKHENFIFLLDSKDCTLSHETIPIFNKVVKQNSINSFIKDNYPSTHIIAFNNYKTDKNYSGTHNACIASVPCTKKIRNLFQYIAYNSSKYTGTYFLSLEFKKIIDNILNITQNNHHTDSFQIFATITKSSNIRIIVKHNNNIMNEQRIKYPHNKSQMYVVGTLEQAIHDKILMYNDYTKKTKAKLCIILLINKNLKKLSKHLKFDKAKLITLTEKDLFPDLTDEEEFQDNILIKIFNNTKSYIATNNTLSSIAQLTLINNIVFRSLLFMIICSLIIIFILQSQIIVTESKIDSLNDKYYISSGLYKKTISDNSTIKNITDHIDLYNIENMLCHKFINPSKYIDILLSFNNPDLQIINLEWKINSASSSYVTNSAKESFNINIESSKNNKNIIDKYMNYINSYFKGYEIIYKNNTSNIDLKYLNIIPTNITIKNINKGNSSVK